MIHKAKYIFLSAIFLTSTLFIPTNAFAVAGSEFQILILQAIECFDDVDNDGDGFTDYPDDPDCSSPNDESESYVEPESNSGGGGGGSSLNRYDLSLSGFAYPLSPVAVLKDGQLIETTTADDNGRFRVSVNDLSNARHFISIYASGRFGQRSALHNTHVRTNEDKSLENIIIAPTLSLSQSNITRGEDVTLQGQALKNARVTIYIKGEDEASFTVSSDQEGVYTHRINTAQLDPQTYLIRTKAFGESIESTFSKTLSIIISSIPSIVPETTQLRGDLNGDNRVNLVDFSIAAFFYNKSLGVNFQSKEEEKLNGDSRIDLVDFSIMAYHWTG